MTEFLDVPGGRIAYDVGGAGPLVVLVPGMGDVRAAYRFVAPALVASGYRVATMDLRGHGESSTGWPSYSQSAVASDLLALIRHLGGPAVVVGHSYSPDSAIAAAVESPDEVIATVLVAPWARRPEAKGFMKVATRAVTRFAVLWGVFYRSLYPGRKPADFGAYLAALKANLREPGRMAALAAMTDPASIDVNDRRAQANGPALIIMGSKDPDFKDPSAEAAAMRDALGGPAGIVMIDGAGHYPHAQYPEETTEAILAFLRQAVDA